MGSPRFQRRSVSVGLAACLGVSMALLPRPGWCGGDDTMHELAPVYGAARSSTDKVLTLQAEPAFIGCSNYSYSVTSVPIAVTVTNRGAARDATIAMEAALPYAGGRVYRRVVHLAEDAVTHVTLDGSFRNYASTVVVRLETGNAIRAEVTTPISNYGSMATSSGNEGRMALLSDRLGALRPVANLEAPDNNPVTPAYETCYLKPESAPDHASGYQSLKVLVAGVGAERLTSAQWQAIRGWVSTGGSLIILAQKDWNKAAPEFAELSPERINDPSQTQVIEEVPVGTMVRSAAQNGLFSERKATAITGMLNVDASPLPEQSYLAKPYDTLFARRQIGAGTVLYSGIDFTNRDLRTKSVTQMWSILGHRATSAQTWRYEHDGRRDWGLDVSDNSADAARNPFTLALPPLTQVVYVFAAYFVLAVPITFVVLKRTRRMNLAWISGPVLAVVFAGVFYLFSFRLYRAPLSRRTTGHLYAAAGDRQARFVGYTEMFFPHGGSYDVTIPYSDRVEPYDEDNGGSRSSSLGLETTDDGVTEQTPDFGVSNLAFRRLYHSQTVDWGTGVTGDIHRIGADSSAAFADANAPKIAGTIVNGTGMTLHHVRVTLRSHSGGVLQANVDVDCPPGRTTLPPTITTSVDSNSDDASLAAPVLTAQVDGASFGPSLGNDVTGSDTVNVVVSLPLPSDEKGGSR